MVAGFAEANLPTRTVRSVRVCSFVFVCPRAFVFFAMQPPAATASAQQQLAANATPQPTTSN